MEFAKNELEALQDVCAQPTKQVTELHDLELSLVGGGCGDVAFG